MVGTFLPPDLKDKPEVSDIYDGLSTNILAKLNGENLSCTYNGKPYSLDTQSQIKTFLTAEDFYNYKFREHEDPFFIDLIHLPQEEKVSLVLVNAPETNSKRVKAFRTAYPFSDYQSQYQQISHISGKAIKSITHKDLPFVETLLLQNAFNYDNLKSTDRHTILLAMDVPVCPYCNMNYTSDYERNGEHRTTADLDHFYIKSEYPEYALCLYNFVPSCPACNSRLKGTMFMTRETHVFPHEESFTDKAEFEITNLFDLLRNGMDGKQVELNLTISTPIVQEQERVEASEQVFELRSRYQAARSEAEELLEKAITYNDTYAAELSQLTPGVADVKQLVFGAELTEEEAARKSLGKLKADLLKQFGVY